MLIALSIYYLISLYLVFKTFKYSLKLDNILNNK